MIRDFDGLIASLETQFPVFATDIRKDEIENNKSFFIYNDDGEIIKAETGTKQYLVEFYLSFVTREKERIDKIKIINMCEKHRLFFKSTSTQVGKIEDLDVETSMVTFTFTHIEKGCDTNY